jgi:hypothetical protein
MHNDCPANQMFNSIEVQEQVLRRGPGGNSAPQVTSPPHYGHQFVKLKLNVFPKYAFSNKDNPIFTSFLACSSPQA